MLSRLSRCIGTCFYLGYFPLAPGTVASLAALITAYFFYRYVPYFVILSLILGLLVCRRVEQDSIKKDPSFFVMDEFCGMMITLWAIPRDTVFWIVAFFFFRFFDILKPWPINLIQRRPGATSIMWDDVVAGAFANLATQLMTYLL